LDVDAIDEERFGQLLEAYGGDAARWPDAERALALRYLAATPAAHPMRAEARRLDRTLDAWNEPEASPGLQARLSAGLPAPRVLRPRALWLSGAGLAAACVFGVMVGAGVDQAGLHASAVSDRDGDAAVTAALDGSAEFTPSLDEGWS
jgi:hypothetical protein